MPVQLTITEFPAAESETAPPLVIAHGLLGWRKNWATLGKRLATNRRVLTADMRNHGESPWDDRHGYQDLAEDLEALIEAHAGGRADVLGHSMGGKSAMAVALTAPEMVRALIVADIAPVGYGHSHQDFIEAMRTIDVAALARRKEAEPILAKVVSEPGVRAFLLQNLATDSGRFYWRPNLDVLSAHMEEIVGWSESLASLSFQGPTLFIRGANSDYVQDSDWPAIRAQFPAAALETIQNAGHWLHAEQPEPFLDAVEAFLDGL